jgi:hypothetical protein
MTRLVPCIKLANVPQNVKLESSVDVYSEPAGRQHCCLLGIQTRDRRCNNVRRGNVGVARTEVTAPRQECQRRELFLKECKGEGDKPRLGAGFAVKLEA